MCTMGADANSSVDDQSLSLRQIIDLAPALIHTARPDGYLDFFNRRWLDFSGQPLEKLLGWGWTSCIHSDEVKPFLQRMRESFARGSRPNWLRSMGSTALRIGAHRCRAAPCRSSVIEGRSGFWRSTEIPIAEAA